MPDDNDLPLQDAPPTTEAASESCIAASGDVEPVSETLIQVALRDLQ